MLVRQCCFPFKNLYYIQYMQYTVGLMHVAIKMQI